MPENKHLSAEAPEQATGVSRRKFLTYAGVLAGATIVGASCKDDDDRKITPQGTIDLGSNDTGLLNFVYAMEQLEAAFFTRVCDAPYTGMYLDDLELFRGIRDHEIIHREYIKTVLGENAIPELETDFSSVDFSSQTSVLAAAKVIQDNVHSGYNYIGYLFVNPAFLQAAAKIVSVEGRHAAYIRDMNEFGSFAWGVDENALDITTDPWTAMNNVKMYFKQNISTDNLPK